MDEQTKIKITNGHKREKEMKEPTNKQTIRDERKIQLKQAENLKSNIENNTNQRATKK